MNDLLDQIICADCLEVLGRIDSGVNPGVNPGAVDLVYLDPPFNTGRTQSTKRTSYEDQWPSMEVYLEFMRCRLEAMVEVMAPQGVMLLHCDWRTVHHFRLMLDDLFTPEGFVNHLIWRYGLGGSSPRRFARKHDDILFYAKGPDYYFDPPLIPATSQRMKGESKKATDVLDVPALNNMAKERTGYPTQKPLALLTMLVEACCHPGGIVLDPFCGSGTTLVAAAITGRRFIGIDRHPEAVDLARIRCADAVASMTS